MSLKLYIGESGSGKSHGLYRELIAASMAYPEENFFLIVPEQYTLQTQKLIAQIHPRHGVMNIDVVSFARLAHRIFEELGVVTAGILEDTGKRMVLSKLLLAHEKELTAFGGSVMKSGFCSELKSMISEFLAYNITPEALLQAQQSLESKDPGSPLSKKLHDLAMIYGAFKDYIKGHYLTSEEILTVLAPLVPESVILKNSWLYLDYFTGFTPSQYVLLRQLLICCKGTVMTMTVDAKSRPFDPKRPYELFYLTKETIYRLNRLCAEIGCRREQMHGRM